MPYMMIINAVLGGVSGYLDADMANDARPNPEIYRNLPEMPDLAEEWLQGWLQQRELTPGLIQEDQRLRRQATQEQGKQVVDLVSMYGPQLAKANLATLQAIDPESIAARKAYYASVMDDFQNGFNLNPDEAAQLEADVRGAQMARGNFRGNAPMGEEALFKGSARRNLYQQRLGNIDAFLRAPTPQDRAMNAMGPYGQALGQLTQTTTAPGMQYLQPLDLGNLRMNNAREQFNVKRDNSLKYKDALFATPNEISPWKAALAGAIGGVSGGGSGSVGSFMGGQSAGGGGGGSSMMGMFGM